MPASPPHARATRLAYVGALVLTLATLIAPATPALRAAGGNYLIADTWPEGQAGLPADAWPAASGVAIDRARRVYVADAVTARISVIEPDGTVRLLHPPGTDPGLVEPHDLAVDDGRQRLYAADRGARAVVVFGLDGRRLAAWGNLPGIVGVAAGPDGTVFAGSAYSGEVFRFAADGTPLPTWRAVRADTGAGNLIVNLDVAADLTGIYARVAVEIPCPVARLWGGRR